MYSLLRRTKRTEARRGAAAVEMAIVLPFFMLLLCGLMQMAWMFLIRHSMLHSAREGARAYAVQGATAGQAQTRATQVLTDLFGSGNASQFTVTAAPGAGLDRIVTVSIPFNSGIVDVGGGLSMLGIMNGLSALIPGTTPIDTAQTMTAQATFRDEAGP